MPEQIYPCSPVSKQAELLHKEKMEENSRDLQAGGFIPGGHTSVDRQSTCKSNTGIT